MVAKFHAIERKQDKDRGLFRVELLNGKTEGKSAGTRRFRLFASFAWKSRTLFLVLLSVGVLPSVFAAIQVQRALQLETKTDSAHTVLELHLMIGELGHRLWNHAQSAGTLDDAKGRSLRAKLDAGVLETRKAIAHEVALRGVGGIAEEGEELERLDAIMAGLNRSLAGQADMGWVDLIDEAVAEERREVAELDALEGLVLRSAFTADVASAVVVFSFLLVALFWLDRSISVPLNRLMRATEDVAQGEKQVRIVGMRDREFAELASNFNRMAAALDARYDQMAGTAVELEGLVADRTGKLEAANGELVQQALLRKQFLTDISHELRTPLAVIRGDAEVTLRGEDKPSEEYKSALARIASQVVGVTRLVDDLLYVARNEGGAPPMQLRPLDLHELLDRSVSYVRSAIVADGGSITVNTRLNSARILGDSQRLEQLLRILLDNAVHYSDDPPDIEIGLLHATEGYAVVLRDNGIGISEAELPTLFDRFSRGRSGKNETGIGIGLPMAKAIVDAHGGTISIESTLEEGTVVTVLLPAVETLKVAHEYSGR